MPDEKLSHVDTSGQVHMVDIGRKSVTERYAVAKGEVKMQQHTFHLLEQGELKKGEALVTAQIAGILAAKRTSDLIPLCHPLQISHIKVECELSPELPGVVITATVQTAGKTGVEMEALMAVSIAALTIYDMAKAVEKTMRIQNIRLIEKHGGSSGDIVND